MAAIEDWSPEANRSNLSATVLDRIGTQAKIGLRLLPRILAPMVSSRQTKQHRKSCQQLICHSFEAIVSLGQFASAQLSNPTF